MTFFLTITTLCLFLLLAIVYYILPVYQRYKQLVKEYRNITFLPLSSVPFLGNIHQFDKRPHVLFQMVCQLTKQCQDQGTGLFCLWYGYRPRVFLCSARGLEVGTLKYFYFKILSFPSL